MEAIALFTGIGLDSMKFTSISGSRRWCSARAPAKSPCSASSTRRLISAGNLVRRDRDDAASADRHQRQRQRVVAREDDEVVRHAGADLAHLRHVAGGLLDAGDVRDGAQADQRRRIDVAAGAAGHVVDDDRQLDRFRDRAVVLVEPFGRRLVVVGRDREDAVGARRSSCAAPRGSLPACCSRRRRRAPARGPRASATTSSTTRTCSASVSVGTSPVVPHGTRKWMPRSICRRARRETARFVERAVAP